MKNTMITLLLEGKIDDIYAKYYGQSIPDREVFDKIIAIDPSFNPEKDKMGQYGQWLLNLYKRGENVLGEAQELKDQLEIFTKTKNKIPQDRRDIMRIHTLQELIDLNAEFEERTSKSSLQLNAEQHPGARFITKSGEWEVYCPETYEASKFLRGDDAVWCTGRHNDDGFYKSYTRDGGKLYIFINVNGGTDDKNGKYQVSIRDGRVREFRDARNGSADFMQFIADSGLFEALGQTEIANTKDYQAVKEVKDTNGKITYSRLMSIKYLNNQYEQSQLFKAIQSFIKIIIVNDGLKMIIPECFKDMKVEKIILPDSVQTLGDGCFAGCTELKKIDIPKGIRVIPRHCFENCKSLEEVHMGANVIEFKPNAFKECNEGVKIKTPHHRITLLKSELDWYKNHIEWTDEVKEESLKEDFSRDVPDWVKPWIVPFKGKDSKRTNNGYNTEQVAATLINNGIDVNKVKIIETEVPTDKNDPIFTDRNKILLFFIPAENASMYRSNKNWGEYRDGDILYIKDINNPKQGSYAQDEISRRTPLQLIKMATKMAYIDKNDPDNFIGDKRSQRNTAKSGSVDRDMRAGQHHVSKWVLYPKNPNDERDNKKLEYDTKAKAMSTWNDNDKLYYRSDSPRVQDVYEYPVQEWSWEHPGEESRSNRWSNIVDKSGFNVTFARHMLDVKLNDYKKHHYQATLDNMRNKLEAIRQKVVEIFNSSLSDVTAIDTSRAVISTLEEFKKCANEYTKIIARLDYIEQMDNKEEQEKELDNLFSFDGNTSFGLTVKSVEKHIKELESDLSEVETTYIESLTESKSVAKLLSGLRLLD